MALNEEAMKSNINQVTIRGPIIHSYSEDASNSITLTIATGVRSHTQKASEEGAGIVHDSSYPTVIFFDELSEKISSNFKEGDWVEVSGEIRAYYNKREQRYMQTVRGLAIRHAETILQEEFGSGEHKGRIYKEAMNQVTLKGRVLRVQLAERNVSKTDFRPEYANILLDVSVNGRNAKIGVNYHGRNGVPFPSGLQKGDTVCAIGCIVTRKRLSHNNKYQYYENLLLTDLVKIEPEKGTHVYTTGIN